MTETNDLLRQGIATLRAGQKAEARRLLAQVAQQDRNNETAWLWLSEAVSTDRERIRCLREVLRINPDNSDARRGLEHLEAKAGATRPALMMMEPSFTLERKTVDFIIGFVGWFVIHSLYWLLLCKIGSQLGEMALALMYCFCLPLPITIIALILLSGKGEWWIALGVYSAFAVNSIGVWLVNPFEADEPGLFLMNIFAGVPFFIDNLSDWLGFQCW